MNDKITVVVLGAAIILQVVLELKGVKVPSIVYILSGFAVRHIIGDNPSPPSDNSHNEVKPT